MSDHEKTYYYRPVPGSRELVTSSTHEDELLLLIESEFEGGDLAPLIEYKGEWLGGARFGLGVVVPRSVFDVLVPAQSPLEQAVYLHLFRLSYGEGRNWCRVGKRELMHRAHVSDRRLNASLDGLVRKGHIKPLHRSTKGTMYRVYLPSEVTGVEKEPGLVVGEKMEAPAVGGSEEENRSAGRAAIDGAGKKPEGGRLAADQGSGDASRGTRGRPLESPINEERFADVTGRDVKGPSISGMAEMFFKSRGMKAKSRDRQLAITVLTDLLEDGFSREEVERALSWFVRKFPEEESLDRLPYFISQALED